MSKAKKEEFFDPSIEPDAVCGNCDYHSPTSKGQMCANTRSTKYTQHTFNDDTCGRFFWPCSKRWPDADCG